MIIDIFTHTRASAGGQFEIGALVEAARAAHLDGIAVTDRAFSGHALELARYGRECGFPIFVGVELATPCGSVVCFPSQVDGEFVGEGWRELGENPSLEDILSYFHSRNGIVVARDAYLNGRGLRDRVYSAKDLSGRGFDALDTVGAHRRRIDNELCIEAANVLGVAGCAGSGVLDCLSDIGSCATMFAVPVDDQASFVMALRGVMHWAVALRDLGDACPMGTAPREEEPLREGGRFGREPRGMRERGLPRGSRDGGGHWGRGNDERRRPASRKDGDDGASRRHGRRFGNDRRRPQ